MRILLVFHGWLPRADRPVSGGALRAWHHARALEAAGHEVLLLTRAQDHTEGGPPTFDSPGALRRYALAARPDRILCVQPEEAPALAGLGVPLCVDLYAPRLLEAVFEDSTGEEATRTLRAIDAGDDFLFSNPRQRWFYHGLMVLAGVDLRECTGAVVPLVAPEAPRRGRRPAEPLFVMGGVSWPWQDPVAALRRAVAHLEARGRGRIVVYGGRPVVGDTPVVDLSAAVPAGERLHYRPALPYGELLAAYSRATAALDVMAPNAEREVALAFRHMDYLACGLPVISGATHALAPQLERAGAGWLVDGDLSNLEAALDEAMDDAAALRRRAQAARALARSAFSLAGEGPLLDWVERACVRERRGGPLPAAADLAAALADARARRDAAERARRRAEVEVAAKREEVREQQQRIQELVSAVARLSGAVDEIAGYRSEAHALLRHQLSAARSDLEKKSLELADLGGELRREHDRAGAHKAEADRLRRELEDARAELARLREQRLSARLAALIRR